MESDDEPIDPEIALARQPWWFRIKWRFQEWRRQRALSRMYATIERGIKPWTPDRR